MKTYRIYYGQNCYTSEWYCKAASEEEAKEAFEKTHTSARIINIEVCENQTEKMCLKLFQKINSRNGQK